MYASIHVKIVNVNNKYENESLDGDMSQSKLSFWSVIPYSIFFCLLKNKQVLYRLFSIKPHY